MGVGAIALWENPKKGRVGTWSRKREVSTRPVEEKQAYVLSGRILKRKSW